MTFRLDPDEYFTFPVTEEDAPDYFDVVKAPMDLISMRAKMDRGEYENLEQFKV